jgi:membrane-bound metal-dependent hydrolase YbcI (DUF457 family)
VASFGIHLAVGLSASGLAATSVLAADLASPPEMLVYLGLGTLGSLLPDIDADNSAPLQIGFTAISIACAFAAMFLSADRFGSVAELSLIWSLTYLLLRWLVFALFTRLTVHRGIFHSLPAALLFGLLTTLAAARLGGQLPFQAWLAGSFVTFGYLVHLVLDELFAVNLFGLRTRRSLGTALKLWFPGSHAASLYMYLACAAALLPLPDHTPFLRVVATPETYTRILERLIPAGDWFRPAPTAVPRTANRL